MGAQESPKKTPTGGGYVHPLLNPRARQSHEFYDTHDETTSRLPPPAPSNSQIEGNSNLSMNIYPSTGHAVVTPHSHYYPQPATMEGDASSRGSFPGDSSRAAFPSLPGSEIRSKLETTLSPLTSSSPDTDVTHSPPETGPKRSPRFHPIPTSTVFSRGALSLATPAIDTVLAVLPSPVFSEPASTNNIYDPRTCEKLSSAPTMFPPLAQLHKGRSIADMMYNTKTKAAWKNRGTVFSFLSSLFLGIAGSSAAMNFYSLTGVYDAIQIFALILSTIVPNAGKHLGKTWKRLFLGTIPNILALNIFPLITQKLLFFTLIITLMFLLLFYFHRVTSTMAEPASGREGLLTTPDCRGAGWGVVLTSFILIVLYLPVSTITMHGLTWSSDFWPSRNGTELNFAGGDTCYTTSVDKDIINLAPFVVTLCVISFVSFTVYFPIRLTRVIKPRLPSVDLFTELGRQRSKVELEHEYLRKLERDVNPLSYLYSDYRRQWGTYKPMALVAKLSALLIISLIDPSNCLHHILPSDTEKVLVVRQAILVVFMLAFLFLQSFLAPFVDPVSNASEWISRVGYVATASIGLVGAASASSKATVEGPVLYTVYAFNYGLNLYFVVIHWSWVQRIVKRISRRIDFSIDVFSPKLDISPTSIHITRRIWNETLTTVLLTSPDTRMLVSQKITYAEAPSGRWPPYLLGFGGSVSERHVENLKILREVGTASYIEASTRLLGPKGISFRRTYDAIVHTLVGPDVYWAGADMSERRERTTRWGSAVCIPFPPTVVINFDDEGSAVLSTLEEFETLLTINDAPPIRKARGVRVALRALDTQVIFWPHTHIENTGSHARLPCTNRGYKAVTTTHFESAIFTLQRRAHIVFPSHSNSPLDFGSGFTIHIRYSPNVTVDGAAIGVDNEFDLTPTLARFLASNETLIRPRMAQFLDALQEYREHLKQEAADKERALSYVFLTEVFARPQSPEAVMERVRVLERHGDGSVLRAFEDAWRTGVLKNLRERMVCVCRSEVTVWWYIFWDDFWRRNYSTVRALRIHAADFDPSYSTSIAYRPVPRAALEAFLVQRGLLRLSATKWPPCLRTFMHTGLLNKVYFRLNQIVFHGDSSKVIHTHIGQHSNDDHPRDDDTPTHARFSTDGTGGGTDHDDEEMRPRPQFTFEGAFDDPIRRHRQGKEAISAAGRYRPWGKLALWFGITPFGRTRYHSDGIAIDVRVEGEHYVPY